MKGSANPTGRREQSTELKLSTLHREWVREPRITGKFDGERRKRQGSPRRHTLDKGLKAHPAYPVRGRNNGEWIS